MKNDPNDCGCGNTHKDKAPPKTRGAQEDYPAKVTPDGSKPTTSFTTEKKSGGDK